MVSTLSDLDRVEVYSGSAWQRLAHYSATGRTVVRVSRATNLAVATLTDTSLTWTIEDSDVDGFIPAGSDMFTVPAGLGGLYGYDLRAVYSAPTGGQNTISIFKNGVRHTTQLCSNDFTAAGSGGTILLAAADTMQVTLYQGSGFTLQVNPASMTLMRLGI